MLDAVGVTQIRPLLLALFKRFPPEEVKKAMPMAVAWAVRFLICGSGGSGTLETYYSDSAHKVSTGAIKTAAGLHKAMKSAVPDDRTFEDAFVVATVSKTHLAKYYLRVLECQKNAKGDELVVNPDTDKVNLEHILPQTPAANWPHVTPEEHSAFIKRIGNLTILNKRLNAKAANGSFADKKKIYATSHITLTKELDKHAQWTVKEIEDRQRELAKLAVSAWPAQPRS